MLAINKNCVYFVCKVGVCAILAWYVATWHVVPYCRGLSFLINDTTGGRFWVGKRDQRGNTTVWQYVARKVLISTTHLGLLLSSLLSLRPTARTEFFQRRLFHSSNCANSSAQFMLVQRAEQGIAPRARPTYETYYTPQSEPNVQTRSASA